MKSVAIAWRKISSRKSSLRSHLSSVAGLRISDAVLEEISGVGVVKVKFSDGKEAKFHTEWLIDHDPSLIHPQSQQRNLDSATFKKTAGHPDAVKSIKVGSNGNLEMSVSKSKVYEDNSSSSYSGVINYSASQLKSMVYSDKAPTKSKFKVDVDEFRSKLKKINTWNADELRNSRKLPIFDYNEVYNNSSTSKEIVKSFDSFGFFIVRNMPQTFEVSKLEKDSKLDYFDTKYLNLETLNLNPKSRTVAVITEHIIRKILGCPRETFYGRMWDTAPKGENQVINDTAYTKDALNVHTDGCYWIDMPGIQVFNCAAQSNEEKFTKLEGNRIKILDPDSDEIEGCTRLLDGFKVMEELIEHERDAFEFMATNKLKWMSKEDNVFMEALEIPFRYGLTGDDNSGDFGFRYNVYDLAPITFLPFDLVPKFYKFNQIVTEVMRKSENIARIRLKTGDMIVLNNHRVCHGREAFTGYRSLVGCYGGKDEWLSRLRQI